MHLAGVFGRGLSPVPRDARGVAERVQKYLSPTQEAVSATVDVLRQVPYFAELEAGPLRDLAGLVRERRCRTDEVILPEGERCEGLYVVLSGRVKVFKVSGEGEEQVLRILGPGRTFNNVVRRRPEFRERGPPGTQHCRPRAQGARPRPGGDAPGGGEGGDPDHGLPPPRVDPDVRSPLATGRGGPRLQAVLLNCARGAISPSSKGRPAPAPM